MGRSFTKAFRALDSDAGGMLFDIEGDLVIPKNERVRLIMADSLGGISGPFVPVCPPISRRELSEMTKTYDTAYIPVQQFPGTQVHERTSNRVRYSGEGLGTFISALYFRTHGYMIGRGSYGTVDDVIAWKSHLLDRLRNYGFVDRGCTLAELARLKCIPGVGACSNPSNANEELVLVEVEPSKSDGLSNSEKKGLNQLKKAWRLKVATGLYICFPLSGRSGDSPASVRAAIDEKWHNGPKIGSILFDENGLYVYGSDNFVAAHCNSAVKRLERQMKETLLAKLSFGEVLELTRRLDMAIENRRAADVSRNIISEIADAIDVTLILDKLNQTNEEQPR